MATPLFIILLLLLLMPPDYQSHARRMMINPTNSLLGTVFCDRCLESRFTHNSQVFSGAEVKITCAEDVQDKFFSTTATTDKTGQFSAEIPERFNRASCSIALLSAGDASSCNVSESESASSSSALEESESKIMTSSYVFMFKPSKIFAFCAPSVDLTLGPPDPPQPSNVKKTDSYHLGPPDPPRPKTVVGTRSYRQGPPNHN